MPGPGKTPAGLKIIAGTTRPDRQSDVGAVLPLVEDLPPAPDWMPNAHAKREWERLTAILFANRLLTEAGLSALGNLCALHGKLVQLWSAGESPTANMLGQYRALVNDFGLTPVAQGKVKPVGDRTPANRFAANGRRTA